MSMNDFSGIKFDSVEKILMSKENGDISLYGAIKRLRIFILNNPGNRAAKLELVKLLYDTSYGKKEASKLEEELNSNDETVKPQVKPFSRNREIEYNK